MATHEKSLSLGRRSVIAFLSLSVAAALWLPTLHWFYRPAAQNYHAARAIPPMAPQLAARQLALWEEPDKRARELARMRVSNAEWDFMGRTYFVLALANMALREPEQKGRYLAVADQIIEETLKLEREKGMYFFLMDYARRRPYQGETGRSMFIDGEIALMLAARQTVEPSSAFDSALKDRIDAVVASIEQSPTSGGESYPDECWTFCNTLAIAAVSLSDRFDGRDHKPLVAKWLATLKSKLIEPKSGLLYSSFTYDGMPMDGPEGSSLWMIAHCLQIIDPDFARQQYDLSRKQIARQVLGFGYATEWPATWDGVMDVDSGPIVPILHASAGSSGLAILGAASFHDEAYLASLMTSLNFAGFPVRDSGQLSFAASNQVGDAVMLYALVQGPLWDRARAEVGK